MEDFREKLALAQTEIKGVTRLIAEEHVMVMKAPDDQPLFGTGEKNLGEFITALTDLQNNLPAPPPMLNDGILGALYSQRARIAPLEIFADNPFLNEKIVKVALPVDEDDTTRKTALEDHQDACDFAYDALCDLINPVLNQRSTLDADQAASASERVISDLKTARAVPITALIDVIKQAARGKMNALADGGNVVAEREKNRADELAAKVIELNNQLDNLADTVAALYAAQGKAKSFKQKQELTKKYQDAKARMGAMKEYITRLDAYDDELALRVERITKAADADAKGLSLVDDPDAYIRAEGVDIAPMGEHAEALLLGALDDQGNHANGIYDNLLNQFTLASKRVTVDVKLFLGEPDLTDISAAQLETLVKILDSGKELADEAAARIADARETTKIPEQARKVKDANALFGKAKFIFDEARKLYSVFNASNKFPLPDAAEVPDSDKNRIGKALKTGAVELDRFWGIGGDGDDSIRAMLTAAGDQYEQVINGNPDFDFTSTETLIEAFEKALDMARKAFVPAPKDQQAKENAAKARDAVVDGLLNLYKTKPLKEGEIGDVPLDHLLVVERNGVKEYHQILTKKDDPNVNRRDDKHIPREAINLLLEQATMLELLAKSNAPDCGDAIAAAVEKCTKMLEGIVNGGDDFDYIAKQIKKHDSDLAKSSLIKWMPDTYQATKVNFESFKEDYKTKFLPAIGREKVDSFGRKIEQLLEKSEKVRLAYVEADKIMVQVEKDFANASGASDQNLTSKLAEIIAAGPQALMNDYAPAPNEIANVAELMAHMKNHLQDIVDIDAKAGMDGPFKGRIKTARQSMETRSATGIEKGKTEAIAIRDEMAAELAKLDPSKGLQYLQDLSAFLKGQSEAAIANKQATEAMQTAKAEVKAFLAKASECLKGKNKATFKSYKEYKTIYDSLKKQYDTAGKSYKSEKDVQAAVSEYKDLLPNARQLATDLDKSTPTWEPGQIIVNFGAFQTTLNNKIGSVRKAALEASEKAIAAAADDEDEVITLTAKAAKTLALAGADEIEAIVQLRGKLQDEANAAINTPDETLRRKLLAAVREKALAEVRRIHNETENHPALKVYRDNPFVKDISWPAFAVSLHGLDVKILTTLQPR
ncbi:MAG: hypothetical protein L3J33_12830 [Rhodobacteraceae bacterium]|nr:hypothetical protein [Paracoccaceae bacterium]